MATKGMTVFTQNGEDFTINDPNIANEFSTDTAYAVGDHVTYQGNLYVFNTAHASGAWNASHVTKVTIGRELNEKEWELKSACSGVGNLRHAFLNASMWTVGKRINYDSDIVEDSTRLTHFPNHITWLNDMQITLPSDAEMFVFFSDGESSGWVSSYWFANQKSYSIVFRYKDNSEINNIPLFLTNVNIKTNIQKALLQSEIMMTEIDYRLLRLGGRQEYDGGYTETATRASTIESLLSFPLNFTIIPDGTVKMFVWYSYEVVSQWIDYEYHGFANHGYTFVFAYKDDRTIDSLAELMTHFTIVPADIYSGFKSSVISILGDSISTFAGENPSQTSDGHYISDGSYTYPGNHCRYPLNNVVGVYQTYWMQLIARTGMKLGINDSWAGSCVTWLGDNTPDSNANVYMGSPTRIAHLSENGTPNIILVNAGTNDIGLSMPIGTFNTESPANYTDSQIANLPVNTFADAYRTMLIRLQKKYPTARVVVMLPDYTTSYYNPMNADKYIEVIKEACDYFGVPYFDMRTIGITMYNTGTFLADGIHPNSRGMDLMANAISKFFKYRI